MARDIQSRYDWKAIRRLLLALAVGAVGLFAYFTRSTVEAGGGCQQKTPTKIELRT